MPAPTTLTAARPSIRRARLPNLRVERPREAAPRRAGSRARSTTVVRSPKTWSCLPGTRAFVEQRQQVRRRRVAVEHDDVPFAGDADDRARHPRRVAPDDRAVARRIRAGQRALRRARVNGDALLLRELDGLRVQHLRARLGHLLRLFVGQRADAARRREPRADRRSTRRRRPSRSRSTPRRAPPPSRPPSCRCRRGRAS